jgi:hypothetical protein
MLNPRVSPAVLQGLRHVQLTKQAAISVHRPLSPSEVSAVQDAQSRWFPRVLVGNGTPLPDTMSSPDKGALMHGGLGAVLGGSIGTGLGVMAKQPYLGAVLGAALGAGIGGAHGYHTRKLWNEEATDLMQRLPAGATYRDYLADSGEGDDEYENDRKQNLRAVRFIANELADDAHAGGHDGDSDLGESGE